MPRWIVASMRLRLVTTSRTVSFTALMRRLLFSLTASHWQAYARKICAPRSIARWPPRKLRRRLQRNKFSFGLSSLLLIEDAARLVGACRIDGRPAFFDMRDFAFLVDHESSATRVT